MIVGLIFCLLAGKRKYCWLELHEKKSDGFWSNLNFKSDLDHHLDTKKKSVFFFQFTGFFKYYWLELHKKINQKIGLVIFVLFLALTNKRYVFWGVPGHFVPGQFVLGHFVPSLGHFIPNL